MKGRFGPALLKVVEAASDDPVERTNHMRRFLKNPQYAGEVNLKSAPCDFLYLNADPLVDVDMGHVGYQIGLLVKDTVFYEQVDDHSSRHLIRSEFPEAVLQGAIGRSLGDIVSGLERMTGVWDPDERITGIATIKGSSHMVVRVPSWSINHYLGGQVHV